VNNPNSQFTLDSLAESVAYAKDIIKKYEHTETIIYRFNGSFNEFEARLIKEGVIEQPAWFLPEPRFSLPLRLFGLEIHEFEGRVYVGTGKALRLYFSVDDKDQASIEVKDVQ
jgi:hypothetical protein